MEGSPTDTIITVAARGPAALRHLTQKARDCEDRPEFVQAAVRGLGTVFDSQACELYRFDRARRTLVLEATSDGQAIGLIGAVALATGDADFARAALRAERPILVTDVAEEARFSMPPDLTVDTVSLLSVRLLDRTGPRGLLVLRRDTVQEFGGEEVMFAELAAEVLALGLARFDERTETERLTDHDGVTGLPNRSGLIRRLEGSLASVVPGIRVGVLVIGVDDFASIANSRGQEAADGYMADVADRLMGAARPGDFLARYSDDQFAVVCDGLMTESDALDSAELYLAALGPRFEIEQTPWSATTSIGVVEVDEPTSDADRVLSDAASATREARRHGRDHIEVFDRRLRDEAMNRLRTEAVLGDVVNRQELVLHYQTLHDLETRAVRAVEALVRWDHPAHGLLPPAQFLPLAEESGLIEVIDGWVVRRALEQAAVWRADHPDLEFVVNLSGRHFGEQWFTDHLDPALEESGVPPSSVRLDLPGTAVGHNIEELAESALALRGRGVRIGLDGVGGANVVLDDIPRLGCDVLTLTRSVVAGLDTVAGSGAVAAAVALLADLLDLEVGAQGVETLEQLTYLRQTGYRVGQGYLFSFPCGAAETDLGPPAPSDATPGDPPAASGTTPDDAPAPPPPLPPGGLFGDKARGETSAA